MRNIRAPLMVAIVTCAVTACSHEAADWKSATLANTSEAYQSFLQQYPHGHEATEAQARIKQLTEERDWQNATVANTRDDYQQFMTSHPDSKWVQEAKIRIENFAQADAGAGAASSSLTANNSADAGTAAADASATSAAPTAAGATAKPAVSAPISKSAASRATSSKVKAARVAAAGRGTHESRRTTAHAGAQWVQLGAFGSKSRAQSHWKQLARRFSALKSLHPHYVAVRAHQHHVYRLQVQVSSAAAASGLCATLKRHAQVCMRVNA